MSVRPRLSYLLRMNETSGRRLHLRVEHSVWAHAVREEADDFGFGGINPASATNFQFFCDKNPGVRNPSTITFVLVELLAEHRTLRGHRRSLFGILIKSSIRFGLRLSRFFLLVLLPRVYLQSRLIRVVTFVIVG